MFLLLRCLGLSLLNACTLRLLGCLHVLVVKLQHYFVFLEQLINLLVLPEKRKKINWLNFGKNSLHVLAHKIVEQLRQQLIHNWWWRIDFDETEEKDHVQANVLNELIKNAIVESKKHELLAQLLQTLVRFVAKFDFLDGKLFVGLVSHLQLMIELFDQFTSIIQFVLEAFDFSLKFWN